MKMRIVSRRSPKAHQLNILGAQEFLDDGGMVGRYEECHIEFSSCQRVGGRLSALRSDNRVMIGYTIECQKLHCQDMGATAFASDTNAQAL